MASGEGGRRLKVLGMRNKVTVEALYKALLGEGHMGRVAKVVASDLEWWFHGPPECHHMMRMLTGEMRPNDKVGFRFEPRSVTAIGGECVITEGWEGKAYWVHVWTVKNEMITQLREYFNTWLVVRDVKLKQGWQQEEDNEEEEEEKRKVVKTKSMMLWQSQPRDLYRRSLPGLVLAI